MSLRKLWLIISILWMCVFGSVLAGDAPTGRWLGTLDAGAAKLRLQLNIQQTEDGALVATMDSLDQGAKGIPAKVSVQGNEVTVEVPSIRGTYKATLGSEGKMLTGTWSQMGQSFPLELEWQEALGIKNIPVTKVEDQPHGPSMPGKWLGPLKVGGLELRLQFVVKESEKGLTATLDSIDQGVNGLEASLHLEPNRGVVFKVATVGGEFRGTLSEDGKSIEGTWTQGSQSLPLTLERTEKGAQINRPQEPKAPYPYDVKEVRFPGGEPGITLAGTLTVPKAAGPFPLAILVSGSGPQNRDEELMGHKPFLVLADHLTRKGIAVLRYDDRGVFESTGDFASATSADFAKDAMAAARFARAQPKINTHAVGIVGHSEGGLIAPMVAAKMREIGFVVLMAGPGVKGSEIILMQTEVLSKAAGEPDEDIKKSTTALAKCFAYLPSEPDNTVAIPKLMAIIREASDGEEVDEATIRREASQMTNPWFRFFLGFDPAIPLKQTLCPVLAINGSLDLQVVPSQNLPMIKQALTQGGNTRVEMHELEGLNHLFQTAKTGSISEYAKIEETMAPKALNLVSDWILKTTKGY